jgi:5-methyltetrahydrofolate--homocysteine methyltransferase
MTTLQELGESVQQGKKDKAKELTQRALDEGLDITKILKEGLIAGMTAIGELFGKGEVYVPEVIMSARAMKEAMGVVVPLLISSDYEYIGKFAIGTVKGDIHDIGKNIVTAVFTGSGFEVVDLGVDVSPERFVEAVRQGAQVVGMSALIGPTMPNIKRSFDALKEAGLRSRVKVVIGGALVTQEYADKVGADAYGADAFDGVRKVSALLTAAAS